MPGKERIKVLITVPLNFQLKEPLPLDCGRVLKQVNIRYETVGTLTPEADNAVLITHALSGNAHVCGRYTPEDPKPGWWDEMVGPGKAIDTDRYFVICSNVIGSCAGSTGPRSIDPDTGNPYNLTFPVITIRDMVRAQKQLVEFLGIKRLLAVIGGSMGGGCRRSNGRSTIRTWSTGSFRSRRLRSYRRRASRSTGSGARRSRTIRAGTRGTTRPTACRKGDS